MLADESREWPHERGLDFTGFVFPPSDPAKFQGKRFTKPMNFAQTSFQTDISFREAEFLGGIAFKPANSPNVSFEGACFHKKADFTTGQFGRLNICNSKFIDAADFKFSQFQRSEFQKSTFEGVADFMNCTWRDVAVFTETRFLAGADFLSSEFFEVADFRAAEFHNGVVFSSSVFYKDANFDHARFITKDDSRPAAKFHLVTFRTAKRASFFGVNQNVQGLSISFLNTNVEELALENVNWSRERHRLTLYDEVELKKQYATDKGTRTTLPYEQVVIVYRQLKKNFEAKHDFGNAEDCSSGVMEIKRLDPTEAFFLRFVLHVYRFASFYGTAILRAFMVLLLIPVGAGILFNLPWFELQNRPKLLWEWNAEAWRVNITSFIHAFEVATFQRVQRYPPGNDCAHFLGILITVLVPGQLALFLLALKRRMKR